MLDVRIDTAAPAAPASICYAVEFFFCLVFVVALFHCFFFISLVDSLYTTLGFWVSSCCLVVLYFSTDPAFFSSLVGSCSCAEVARAYEQTKP
jgi:hypothetical protein